MTFHAPQSNARLVGILARRLIWNRTLIAGAAVVSTSVVLAGRGDESMTRAIPDGLSQYGLHHPGVGDPVRSASLDIKDVPDMLRLPRHRDRKITHHLYRDPLSVPETEAPAKPIVDSIRDTRPETGTLLSGDQTPPVPEAKSVRVASLSPTNRDWGVLDIPLTPRLPELGPVPITPSAALPSTDSLPEIGGPETGPVILTLTALAGETLEAMLGRADLEKEDYRSTLVALRADDISQGLIEGDMIDLAFLAKDDRQLLAMRLRPLGQPPVELRWDSDTTPLWNSLDADPATLEQPLALATLIEPEPETLSITGKRDDTIFVSAKINSSLYASATKAGLTAGEAKAITDIFRYSVDFERDLRKGDHFEALFEKKANGSYGDILYAKLTNRGSEIALYRGTDDLTGETGYFDATGKTNKRSLMRTPVAGARVSSHFGMRMHPILGYNKMHRGTDFRAPTGTPIFAAGDGIIEYLGRKGGYGKYIRIRHNGTYETAYAHMSRYASGLQSGHRVRQGDVIGYVGSTGRSTGPHLHFEILQHGNQIDPLKIADFGPVRGLSGPALSKFLVRVSRIEVALALLRNGSRVASSQ